MGSGQGGETVRLYCRKERKYEVGAAAALYLRDEIARRLPVFEFEKGEPHTFVTTLYFDTKDRVLFQRAERHYDDNIKIRVKEYYYPLEAEALDGAPGAARSEAATRLNGRNGGAPAWRISGNCYVELKQSARGLVVKKRLRCPKEALAGLLTGRNELPLLLKGSSATHAETLRNVYAELARYLNQYELVLSSIVTYRRVVYQQCEETLRITFDDRLAVHAPYPAIYQRAGALTPDTLGPPVRKSDRVILEVKCPGEYPEWLHRAMQHYAAKRLSKFTTSIRLLLHDSGQDQNPPLPPARVPGDAAAAEGGDTEAMKGFFS